MKQQIGNVLQITAQCLAFLSSIISPSLCFYALMGVNQLTVSPTCVNNSYVKSRMFLVSLLIVDYDYAIIPV